MSAALVASAALFAGPASAYKTFFGEDLNGSPTTALSATPKAIAAQTGFLALLENPGVENFESQTAGTGQPLALTFQGVGTATLQGSTGVVKSVAKGGTDGAGRYSVPSDSTTNYWEVTAGTTSGSFTVAFGQASVAAFGFYGIDVGDFDGQLELELVKASGGAQLIVVPNAVGALAEGSVLFFGVVADDPNDHFTSVNFRTTSRVDADLFAFDNFTIAELKRDQPVPEPGSLALVAFGLAALAAAARRRRR